MAAAAEVGLTASREIRRNLRSTKGIAMFALFFLGGAVPSVVQVLFLRLTDATGMNELPLETRQQMFEKVLEKSFDAETARFLSLCPPVLLFLFKGTLIFLPLFVLLVGFDQIAAEIQHRSIRYLAGRARRSSIVAGKALGVWAVAAVMIFVLHATVWGVMIARGAAPAGLTLSWGLRLWVFAVADAAAYVGLTALLSSFFRTPIVALFTGVAVLFVLWLANTLFGLSEATQALTWAFPASYEKLLVSPNALYVMGGFVALLGWGTACAASAAAVVTRRDI